jgi:long-chain acyl-CoA synthetase
MVAIASLMSALRVVPVAEHHGERVTLFAHNCTQYLEEALLTHPDVREVSAIGTPDPEWGEIVVACVVLEEGAAPGDARLDAHCLASIARFKRPKRYVYLDALPKNNYGKVLKTALRELMT